MFSVLLEELIWLNQKYEIIKKKDLRKMLRMMGQWRNVNRGRRDWRETFLNYASLASLWKCWRTEIQIKWGTEPCSGLREEVSEQRQDKSEGLLGS